MKKKSTETLSFWIVGLSLLACLFLSLSFFVEICKNLCAKGQEWRLFGFSFQVIGTLFFGGLLLLHLLSLRFKALKGILGLALGGAFGSELIFIWIQKVKIGTWCPICVWIAVFVCVAFLGFLFPYLLQPKLGDKKTMYKTFALTTAIFIGMVVSFFGAQRVDAVEESQTSFKEELRFGLKRSPVEVYLFSDWVCPSCLALEPSFKQMAPLIMDQASLFFVDHAVHPETMNFIPFNLSFMVYEKGRYLDLRQMLTELAKKTKDPSDEEIKERALDLGVDYRRLNYADVAIGTKLFKELAVKFSVQGTPTLVLINTRTGEKRMLEGDEEITRERVIEALKEIR